MLQCALTCLAMHNVACRGFQWNDSNCRMTSGMLVEVSGYSTSSFYRRRSVLCLSQTGFRFISSPGLSDRYCIAPIDVKADFQTASDDCKSKGASLVYTDSHDKVKAVREAFGTGLRFYWTSMAFDQTTGKWKDENGHYLQDSLWDTYQPTTDAREMCVAAKYNGFLHDYPCGQKCFYACEIFDVV